MYNINPKIFENVLKEIVQSYLEQDSNEPLADTLHIDADILGALIFCEIEVFIREESCPMTVIRHTLRYAEHIDNNLSWASFELLMPKGKLLTEHFLFPECAVSISSHFQQHLYSGFIDPRKLSIVRESERKK